MKKKLNNQKIITCVLAIIFIVLFFGFTKITHSQAVGTDAAQEMMNLSEGITVSPTPDAAQEMMNLSGGVGNTSGNSGNTNPNSPSGGAESVTAICADVNKESQKMTSSINASPLTQAVRGSGVSEVWKWLLSLIDYLIAAMLIFIAIANILQIQIDTYAIRKALPNLIIGVILANLSWFFCMALIDLATAIVNWENASAGGSVLASLYQILFKPLLDADLTIDVLAVVLTAGTFVLAGFLGFLVGIIVLLIPIALFLAIWFLLFARVYVVEFLVAVSPIFFFAIGFPMTTKYFQQWWDWFWKWVFMAPLVFFLWVFAIKIGESLHGSVINYVMVCLVLYFSLRLPFMLGGAIMGAWGNFGKFAAGLGWKGYGSAMGKMSSWDSENEKNPLKRTIGGLASYTNLYGVNEAFKERFALGEKKRSEYYHGTTNYKKIAGYEASARYWEKEASEAAQGAQSTQDLDKKFNNPSDPLGKSWKTAQDYIVKEKMNEDQKNEFYYDLSAGPKSKRATLGQKMKLNPQQLGFLSAYFNKRQNLARQWRSRSFTQTEADIKAYKPSPMGFAGAAAGTAEAETGAEDATHPPQNPQEFHENAKNIHGEVTNIINTAKQGGVAGGPGVQTAQLSNAKIEADLDKMNGYLAKMSAKSGIDTNHQDSFGKIKSAYSAAVNAGVTGRGMEKLSAANDQINSHLSMNSLYNDIQKVPNLQNNAPDSYHMLMTGKVEGIEGISNLKDLTPDRLRGNSELVAKIQPLLTREGHADQQIVKFTKDQISNTKNNIEVILKNQDITNTNITSENKSAIYKQLDQSSVGKSTEVRQKMNEEKMKLDEMFTKLNHLESAESNLNSLVSEHGPIVNEINKKLDQNFSNEYSPKKGGI